ncbi:colicin V production protein [Lachnotalea glycerini]|uniref:Colicin V production protein n=1 Tax=Lachnotalea glycerini TaxID=1763509 RepID=A0A255IBR2_9FIRM|nr:CvpA family protein [Lachnotalea glycerini]PXV84595.1 colicin V production protein [Lachnotalea glycerini]RDY28298.1 CvpA family protein [Lachnotalea glycerini]
MNWLLLVVSVFLIICALNGYRLGFVKKLFTTVSFIITIIAASALAPHVSEFLINNTSVYNSIKEGSLEVLGNAYTNQDENTVEDIKVPTILKKILTTQNSDQESITSGISDYLATQFANAIINAISFAMAFIVITFILRTTVFTLDIIANLPIIKGINQYAGLILGAGEGIIIVWVFFLIITIMGNTELGTALNQYIEDSKFLSFIYNNNYFFKLF